MKIKMKTLAAGSAGDIDLPDDIFGLEPRADILSRVVNWQLAKRRRGTHKAKIRSEVKVTGAKMYKQKGTGNARHGDRSVPQFRGGGKAFGPLPRSHAYDLPKQIRSLGLKHALSSKARDNKLVVIDQLKAGEAKTKAMKTAFDKLGIGSALVVDTQESDLKFLLSIRNLPHVDVIPAAGLNVYDILRRDTLVLSKAAVTELEARFK
jgi:large subunit ribosomal protein L4